MVLFSVMACGTSPDALSDTGPVGSGDSTPGTSTGGDGSSSGGDGSTAGGGDGATGGGDGSTGTTPTTPTGAPGFLHTNGGQIVDADGNVVRLTGISWFGFETGNFAPHGLWSRSLASMLDQIVTLGYNTLRVPFCSQLFDAASTPQGIDFNQNADLVGKTGPQILDAVIAGAKARHLKVILDRHRPDSNAQSALWYTDQYSEQRWIDDWKMLATKYKDEPTVIGFDLHNEPHGEATWGDGNAATDWRLAAERAGNAVLAINPHLLIIVEGIEKVGDDSYWWGGNLKNAGQYPVRLDVPNQLVYSAHDYPASVFAQTWFSAADYPANLPSVWDAHWGYLQKEGTAPVWVGEFGTKNETALDQAWFTSMASYLKTRGISFAFWCLNPDSGDTGGILKDDWQSVDTGKQSVLQPLLAPLLP